MDCQSCFPNIGNNEGCHGELWGWLVSVNDCLGFQVKKSSTVIPRNSHIEANQSGLIAEPLIDITPQLPIPDYKVSSMFNICILELTVA